MFNKKTYNVEFTPRKKRSKYDMERESTHEFLASQYSNVCFEYGNEREAKGAYQAITKYIREARQPLSANIRGNTVVLTRKTKEV